MMLLIPLLIDFTPKLTIATYFTGENSFCRDNTKLQTHWKRINANSKIIGYESKQNKATLLIEAWIFYSISIRRKYIKPNRRRIM